MASFINPPRGERIGHKSDELVCRCECVTGQCQRETTEQFFISSVLHRLASISCRRRETQQVGIIRTVHQSISKSLNNLHINQVRANGKCSKMFRGPSLSLSRSLRCEMSDARGTLLVRSFAYWILLPCSDGSLNASLLHIYASHCTGHRPYIKQIIK